MQIINSFRHFFLSRVEYNLQKGVILFVAVLVIFLPKEYGVDWELNTRGFWSHFPEPYHNPNFVYPPWGLILMLPYWIMHAEGARFFSVLILGWLVIQQKWSLSLFFSIVLSPYFIFTMLFSNMDILVIIFPLLLWKKVDGTRWQNLGWGFAIAVLMLKPQAAILILIYLLWTSRKRYKELALPAVLVIVLLAPVSLAGRPALIIQWLENIRHPSAQNQLMWAKNNLSLSSDYTFSLALVMLIASALFLYILRKMKKWAWTHNHTIAGLLLGSMLLSPYASQQGVSSALAFVPSWWLTLIQYLGYFSVLSEGALKIHSSLRVLVFGFCALLFFHQSMNEKPFI